MWRCGCRRRTASRRGGVVEPAALLDRRREPARRPARIDAEQPDDEPLGGGRGAVGQVGRVERVADRLRDRRQVRPAGARHCTGGKTRP